MGHVKCTMCLGEGFKATMFSCVEAGSDLFKAISGAIEKGTCPLCEGKGYLELKEDN